MLSPIPFDQSLPDVTAYYEARPHSRWKRFRRRAGGTLIEMLLRSLSRVGKLFPYANPKRHGLEVIRDIPYQPTGSPFHTLDVYRPIERWGLMPALLYVHGGGFRILSKDTHWMMGIHFAKHGYITFNMNYRLTPKHPYPAAAEDCSHALLWLLQHAEEYGADPRRIILAGESAGGNLVTMLTVASHFPQHSEPWAQALFASQPSIKAVLPACGLHQVSRPDRFLSNPDLLHLVRERIIEVSVQYLPEDHNNPGKYMLADPLLFLEQSPTPARPLPPFFVFAGDQDPIVDDSIRLHHALARLDVPCELRIYPGEDHAFHALIWKQKARECWRHQINFIERQLREPISFPTS